MKKPALIIAAYPGMGQEIFSSIYDNYKVISMHEFTKKEDNWADTYVKHILEAIEEDGIDVCLVDPHKTVITKLGELRKPFLIFYPGTDKTSIMKMLATLYFRNQSVVNAKYLADVVLNHDDAIEDLRKYPNSILISNGILSYDLIEQLIAMDEEGRNRIVTTLRKMKETGNHPFKESKDI